MKNSEYPNGKIDGTSNQGKSILWISRHTMTDEQIGDLQRIYGDIIVDTYKENVNSASEVLCIGKNYDIFAIVLPQDTTADLVNLTNKPVIRAKSNRVSTGKFIVNPANNKSEEEFMFQHNGWEQILKIEIVVKSL